MSQVVITTKRPTPTANQPNPVPGHDAAPAQDQLSAAALSGRPKARLNTFQRLMRRWNHLGPYNAGQLMQIRGAPNLACWQAAVQSVLKETGLGIPQVHPKESYVTFTPVEQVTIEPSITPWQVYCNTQINRPFLPHELPLRFFISTMPENHFLGVIYDHWIADSRAMRELMSRIQQRYAQLIQAETPQNLTSVNGGTGPNPANLLPPLTLETPTFQQLYGRYLGVIPRLTALRQSLHNFLAHRRAYRIHLDDPLDFHSSMIYRQLPVGLIDQVHHWAKAHQASVNDAFLVVLGQTMGAFTAPDRYKKRKRRWRLCREKIGLGTIVDIRDLATQPLTNVFGLFLSSYTVVLQHPEQQSPTELIQTIAQNTRTIKANHTTVRGFAALESARRWWDLSKKPKWRALFFQKNIPLAAGISNVNMTQSPPISIKSASQERDPMVLDYLRISPTGPLLPLVFTLTTIGDRLSLCVTFRTTAFSHEQTLRIMDDFVTRLTKLGTDE